MGNWNPDAVTKAVDHPDPASRDALRRRDVAEARSLADRRVVAIAVLAGGAIGAAVAYMSGVARLAEGVLWGGIAVAAITWAGIAWRRHREA